MRRIVFPAALWSELSEHMLGHAAMEHGDETLAFLLTAPRITESTSDMLVRRLVVPGADDYQRRSRVGIQPTPEFVARVLSECRREGYGLLEVHTHPFDSSDRTTFSGIDWANDRAKMPRLHQFMSDGFQHATMVMGTRAFDAHYYNPLSATIESVDSVVVVGAAADEPVLTKLIPTSRAEGAVVSDPKAEERFDRQVRFIGARGMQALRKARVGVVGVGGIGSFVALELAHLGVAGMTLVDPDRVEATNLNRLVGASHGDVGTPKVQILSDNIERVNPVVEVTAIESSIDQPAGLRPLKDCDIVLGCVDNHGARLVLNQFAVQYLIPLIDAGSGIRTEPTLQYGGQVQVVTTGRGCLLCRGFIDASKAAFDLASPEHQEYERSHGYGLDDPAPSVVTINGVVASLQVGAVLRILAQDGVVPDLVVYQGQSHKVFPVTSLGQQDCPACSLESGRSAYGDLLSESPEPSPVAPPEPSR